MCFLLERNVEEKLLETAERSFFECLEGAEHVEADIEYSEADIEHAEADIGYSVDEIEHVEAEYAVDC